MSSPDAQRVSSADELVPFDRWEPRLPELAREYRSASPYPHAVLDDFLVPAAAEEAMAAFPTAGEGDWLHYHHYNEKKLGRTDRENFPPPVGAVLDALNSERFLRFLAELTGIHGLLPDETLEGGGLHQTVRGGFLNIHADFTVHPHRRNWRRRVNVLVYLNKDWDPAYGGELELWDRTVSRCERKIAPTFNRAVIFNTDEDAFHGSPHPLSCPEGASRKSLALYYFTEESDSVNVRSTEYRARPEDGLKRVLIFGDKMALRGYDFAKRRLGLDDRYVSRMLRRLSRRK